MAKNRREQIRMTEDEVDAFIESRKSLQVATLNKDGSPHLTTLWFGVVDGDLVFETFTKRKAGHNSDIVAYHIHSTEHDAHGADVVSSNSRIYIIILHCVYDGN